MKKSLLLASLLSLFLVGCSSTPINDASKPNGPSASVSDDEKWPDTELLNDEPNGENQVLVYRFNTAWSPAVPAIEKLSEQYPDLLFTHSFEEEQGWGGELEILNGNLLSESQYDWKCRECDHMLDETPFCEACEYDVCPSCGYNEADEPCEEHKDEE